MASAIKSIESVRFSQRIPPEKRKRSKLLTVLWTLIYVSIALFLVTTSIVVGVCASLLDAAWRFAFGRNQNDNQRKS